MLKLNMAYIIFIDPKGFCLKYPENLAFCDKVDTD